MAVPIVPPERFLPEDSPEVAAAAGYLAARFLHPIERLGITPKIVGIHPIQDDPFHLTEGDDIIYVGGRISRRTLKRTHPELATVLAQLQATGFAPATCRIGFREGPHGHISAHFTAAESPHGSLWVHLPDMELVDSGPIVRRAMPELGRAAA